MRRRRFAANPFQLCFDFEAPLFLAATGAVVVASALTSPSPGRCGGGGCSEYVPRIWRRIAAGDAAAREQVLADNRRVALAMARDKANAQHGADDLYQIACLALNEAITAYKPSRRVPFIDFARGIIKRRFIDTFRHRVVFADSVDDDRSRVHELSDGSDDLVDVAARSELRTILDTAIGGLRPSEQAVLTRHYRQGMPMAEIAKQMGLRRTSVYSVRQTAFARLADALADKRDAIGILGDQA